MKVIYDPVKITDAKRIVAVNSFFDTAGLEFVLLRYAKGETIASPLLQDDYLQFVFRGSLSIYLIREDGTMSSLAHNEGGAWDFFLLGDIQFPFYKSRPAEKEQLPAGAFYAEARTEVWTLALSLERYHDALARDTRFLNLLVSVLAGKLRMLSFSEGEWQSLSDRLINYMTFYCRGGILKGIEHTAFRLHCSSRHLQRLLNQLEEEGTVEKCGKGAYRILSPDRALFRAP